MFPNSFFEHHWYERQGPRRAEMSRKSSGLYGRPQLKFNWQSERAQTGWRAPNALPHCFMDWRAAAGSYLVDAEEF
jgi:hypothetical protein